MLWFHARVCRGPTPRKWIVREARLIARRLRLRRVPEIVMVRNNISPMVWCGARPRLLLPMKLWRELDRTGRRAILCHELAHLRRRDHWVRWVELTVGALYWWHPVIWWVRHRIHEEADSCCDAWVTWLMPRGRRAYAEALLKTKSFVDSDAPLVHSTPTMGVVTRSGARRLARRITMVMTQSARPRHSFTGIALASSLMLVAWVLAPVFADANIASMREFPLTPEKKITSPEAPLRVLDEVIVVDEPAKSPKRIVRFESPGRSSGGTKGGETCAADCSARRVCQPAAKGEPIRIAGANPKTVVACSPNCSGTCGAACSTKPTVACGSDGRIFLVAGSDGTAVPVCVEEQVVIADDGQTVHDRAQEKYVQLLLAGDEERCPPQRKITTWYDGRAGAAEARVYELPEGKLEALTKIMIRADVPIPVQRLPEGLEVHGTPAQHQAFAAFVHLITDREERWHEYACPEAKLGALTELMIRDDVPVKVRPDQTGINVLGDMTVQHIFRGFLELISPTQSPHPIAVATGLHGVVNAPAPSAPPPRARTMDIRVPAPPRGFRSSRPAPQPQRESQIRSLQGQLRGLEDQMNALLRQAEKLRERAERLEEQIDDTGNAQEQGDHRLGFAEHTLDSLGELLEKQSRSGRTPPGQVFVTRRNGPDSSTHWYSDDVDAAVEFEAASECVSPGLNSSLGQRLHDALRQSGQFDPDTIAALMHEFQEQINSALSAGGAEKDVQVLLLDPGN